MFSSGFPWNIFFQIKPIVCMFKIANICNQLCSFFTIFMSETPILVSFLNTNFRSDTYHLFEFWKKTCNVSSHAFYFRVKSFLKSHSMFLSARYLTDFIQVLKSILFKIIREIIDEWKLKNATLEKYSTPMGIAYK